MNLTFLIDSLKFYRQHFLYLMTIMMPIAIPMVVVQSLVYVRLLENPESMQLMMVSFATALFFYPIYKAALVTGIQEVLHGRMVKPMPLISQGVPFWFPILLVNLLFYLAIGFGLLLLIIPGIYFGIRLVLAEQNVILDNESASQALKSSFEETSDVFWYILFGIVALVLLTIAITFPLNLVFEKIAPNSAIGFFIPNLISQGLYPLFVIFLLRIRHYIRHNE